MDVSIIIPAYNRLWSLPEAIASCPQGEKVEIIVVDDGSTDGTWDWLQRQPGITAIRQSNAGKPAAVNAGFAVASGAYVRFMDSDDLLITGAAREQLAFALAEKPDICVAGYLATYAETGAVISHPWHDAGDFIAQQLGECDSSHYSAYLFRRGFIENIHHRSEFAFRDDRMFVLECALAHPSVAAWPQPTLEHRHHARSRIQFQRGSVAIVTDWQELRMFRQITTRLNEAGELSDRRKAAVANNLWPLALRIAGYNRAEGRLVLEWLWSLQPSFAIPRHGINKAYRLLGIPVAQTLVNGARTMRNLVRTIRGTSKEK